MNRLVRLLSQTKEECAAIDAGWEHLPKSNLPMDDADIDDWHRYLDEGHHEGDGEFNPENAKELIQKIKQEGELVHLHLVSNGDKRFDATLNVIARSLNKGEMPVFGLSLPSAFSLAKDSTRQRLLAAIEKQTDIVVGDAADHATNAQLQTIIVAHRKVVRSLFKIAANSTTLSRNDRKNIAKNMIGIEWVIRNIIVNKPEVIDPKNDYYKFSPGQLQQAAKNLLSVQDDIKSGRLRAKWSSLRPSDSALDDFESDLHLCM